MRRDINLLVPSKSGRELDKKSDLSFVLYWAARAAISKYHVWVVKIYFVTILEDGKKVLAQSFLHRHFSVARG